MGQYDVFSYLLRELHPRTPAKGRSTANALWIHHEREGKGTPWRAPTQSRNGPLNAICAEGAWHISPG